MNKRVFSTLTSWLIRLLCGFVIFIGVCLLVLSALGGTSEYHRQGLEQAFSESLKSTVTVGTLEEFNIFPQLVLQAKDIHGVSKAGGSEFMADKVRIAFGFTDLILGRKRIEDFQLDNLRFAATSETDLRLDHAGIDKQARFSGEGQYADRKFDFALSLVKAEAGRDSYSFADKNLISGDYGSLSFSGEIIPAEGDNAVIVRQLQITSGGKDVATGTAMRKNGVITIGIDCPAWPGKTEFADLQALSRLYFVEMKPGCNK